MFGTEALRDLGKSKKYWNDGLDGWKYYYRKWFFEDIKYRSKLRRKRDKILKLQQQYGGILAEIKSAVKVV